MVGTQIAYPGMALLYEVARCQPGTVAVIQRHAALFETGQNAVNQYHAGDLFHQRNELSIRHHFGVDNQCRTAVANQLLNCITFFLLIVITVANEQEVASAGGDLFNRFYHGAKKRVRDISDHQTDRFRRLLRQRSGIGVGVIAQTLHGGLDRQP